jgi:hypothetical protein
MGILCYGILLFLAAFFIHFVIWKIHLPEKNQTVVLLKVFFGVFIFGIILFETTSNLSIFGIKPPGAFLEYVQLFLLHSSLTLAYIVSYSAIEVDSPSLYMILAIAKASGEGLAEEKLYFFLNDAYLVLPRIKDLAEDAMIYTEGGRYKLTSKGIFLARLFIMCRKILNLPKGG